MDCGLGTAHAPSTIMELPIVFNYGNGLCDQVLRTHQALLWNSQYSSTTKMDYVTGYYAHTKHYQVLYRTKRALPSKDTGTRTSIRYSPKTKRTVSDTARTKRARSSTLTHKTLTPKPRSCQIQKLSSEHQIQTESKVRLPTVGEQQIQIEP